MSAIEIPDLLGRFVITTLTFEDLASLDGEELGSASNPYAVIGLIIFASVKAGANLNSSSRGTALKSKRLLPDTSQTEIELRFAKPQGGFGFFYRAPHATLLKVTALDSQETALEEAVFRNGEGYAGVIRAIAEIGCVRIVARIESLNPVEDSCFYIDDLSFGRDLKAAF